MMSFKSVAITVASLGVLFLGACSSGSNQASSPSPATTTAAEPKPSESAAPASTDKMPADKMPADKMPSDQTHGGQGGQVVEVGDYHLELLLGKESGQTHMDVFLQKGEKHDAVPNATVKGQIQLPDGAQKALAFEYDPAEKHYTAKLPSTAPGDYKVVILSDIKGEKVNGRFSFKQ